MPDHRRRAFGAGTEEEEGRIGHQVAELSRATADLQQRLATVEQRLGITPAVAPKVPIEAPEAPREPPAQEGFVPQAGVLALAGRTLLALAGGYLLRALAEGDLLPPSMAVLLGLLYAALWILAADRAAAHGRLASAGFHAAAASLLGFPLVWETTRVFGLLSPELGATALGGLMMLLVLVTWRHGHHAPAWLGSLGGALVAILLLRLAPVPFGALLLTHGAVTLWVALGRRWIALPWVTAATATLGVALAAAFSPEQALPLQLALFIVYAGTFAVVALLPGWRTGALAFVQMPLALALGYAGAMSAAGPSLRIALGGAGIVAGAAAYALGLRRLGLSRRGDLAFLSLLGLLTVLAGSAAASPAAPLGWAVLALAATLIGNRLGRLTLTLHGALFALAAAAGSGLLTMSGYVWAAPAAWPWPPLTVPRLGALAAALLCLGIAQPDRREQWQEWAHAPRLLLLALVTFGGGASLLQMGARLFGDLAGPGADAARLAVARTATLAALALLLALASRLRGQREAFWLVYGLLALGGLKLLGEDLIQGRAASLVLSLSIYGTALIVAPRLGRRGEPAARALPAGAGRAPP